MNRKRKNIIGLNEISELRTYTLNGFEQKVLIEGRKKTNPIVLFLSLESPAQSHFVKAAAECFPNLQSGL